jgi:hypothetical protein
MYTDTVVDTLFTVNIDALEQVKNSSLQYLIVDDVMGGPDEDIPCEVIQFAQTLPGELIECLSPDELIEFIGIDAEFLIAIEPDFCLPVVVPDISVG